MTEMLTSKVGSNGVRETLSGNRRQGGEQLRLEPTRSRRPVLAVGSMALVAACAAIFALIYTRATHESAVIEIARPVLQGQLLTSADIRETQVAGTSQATLVPYADSQEFVGKAAAVSLVPGALLVPGDVGTSGSPATGEAVVGVDLKPGMLPATGVEPGETVMIVLTEPSGSPVPTQTSGGGGRDSGAGTQQTSVAPTVIGTATVVSVDDSPDGSSDGNVVASVELSEAIAPVVADASAAGQAALIEVAADP